MTPAPDVDLIAAADVNPADWVPIAEAHRHVGRTPATIRDWVTDKRITPRGGYLHVPTLLDVERRARHAMQWRRHGQGKPA